MKNLKGELKRKSDVIESSSYQVFNQKTKEKHPRNNS